MAQAFTRAACWQLLLACNHDKGKHSAADGANDDDGTKRNTTSSLAVFWEVVKELIDGRFVNRSIKVTQTSTGENSHQNVEEAGCNEGTSLAQATEHDTEQYDTRLDGSD
jgi:hypothetical protein